MATFALGDYKVDIAEDFGPRIVGLRRAGGGEVLASLGPDSVIQHAGGVFRFRGGHRLWAAPEIPASTYASDDEPCTVVSDDDRLTVTGEPDSAGLAKTMSVTLDGDALLVEHTIDRENDTALFAAWGITQLPLGGTALVPIEGPDTSPLPNRSLILWPYTDLGDTRLAFHGGRVEIEAGDGEPLKLGTAGWRSRLGYLRKGQLFTKEIVTSSAGVVPDFGSSHQVYVGQGFCELETIGGQVTKGPARLTERWQVIACGDIGEAWELVTAEALS